MKLNYKDYDESTRQPLRRRPSADPAAVHAYYGQVLGVNSGDPSTFRAYEKTRRQERLADRARKDRQRRAIREDY